MVEKYVDVETAKQTGQSGFAEMVNYFKKQNKPTTQKESHPVLLVEKTDRLYRNLKDWVILDEFCVCATCGYHRKHAIRLLRRFRWFIKPRAKKRGRAPVYHQETILKPLKQIWLAANLPCSWNPLIPFPM